MRPHPPNPPSRPVRRRALGLALLTLAAGGVARAQQAPSDGTAAPPPPEGAPPAPPTLDDTLEAGESQAKEPRRKLVKWNEYKGPWFTVRLGGGLLLEGASFFQDAASRQQFALSSQVKLRDARLLFKGSILPRLERLTWSMGVMYDGPTHDWLFRETGIMVAVPELWSHFFVGRTKEGFSLNKVMVGYAGWTMERSTINDATIPILADGIKWLGYVPRRGILWNLGWYNDLVSHTQTFSTYHNQYVARLAWLPLRSEKQGTLLHLGVNFRYGEPEDHKLKLRSRPEAFPAPYFVETDSFPTSVTRMASVEAYYRPGPWLFGTEYFVQRASSREAGNPVFHGGEVAVSWLVTGEVRAYNTRGGFFNQVSPAETLTEGGPGAVELVGRVSYIDLDSGTLHGGRFLRFTPMVNWHVTDHVRLEFAYGYGILDRFNLRGGTQFLQSRLQLQL